MKDTRDPSESSGAPIGARNDDSSLFSLDSLKHAHAQDAARKQKKAQDDSGLIDLRALGAIEKSAERPAGLEVASHVAPADIFGTVAPVAAPPPVALATAPVKDDLDADLAPKKSRTVLVAVCGVLAVAAAVAAFVGMRSSGDQPQAATTTSAAAPPAAPPAPPAPPTAVAEEPKSAAVTPGQGAVKEPPAVAKVPGPLPKAAGRAPAPKAAAAPPPEAPAKPVETCDLGCQMQRAVNKK